MDRSDLDLLNYSNGSYSTSDTGCRGDVIGIAPRIFPLPPEIRMYENWAEALQEAADTCALQNGVCWLLKPSQIAPRYGQEAAGGCPGCCGPGPTGFAGFGDAPAPPQGPRTMRTMGRQWTAAAVVTSDGVALCKHGAVLPLWQRIFKFAPPERLVMAPAGLDYKSAVYGAQVLSERLGRPMVVGGERDGRTIPVMYVEPGGLVRGVNGVRDPVKGWETDTYAMDPFEVRQAFAASRGGSIMPWNATGG